MQTKTCKDCLCYEACGYHITEETEMTVEECSTGFKNKEEYVKLPVYVGQPVWRVRQNTFNGLVCIINGKVSMLQQKADKSWKFRVSDSGSVSDYTFDEIGKYIFLSKDAADTEAAAIRQLRNGGAV